MGVKQEEKEMKRRRMKGRIITSLCDSMEGC